MELNKLKDDLLTVKKNTGEATDQKNTWATKYEALERNFKQVNERTYGRRAHLVCYSLMVGHVSAIARCQIVAKYVHAVFVAHTGASAVGSPPVGVSRFHALAGQLWFNNFMLPQNPPHRCARKARGQILSWRKPTEKPPASRPKTRH